VAVVADSWRGSLTVSEGGESTHPSHAKRGTKNDGPTNTKRIWRMGLQILTSVNTFVPQESLVMTQCKAAIAARKKEV